MLLLVRLRWSCVAVLVAVCATALAGDPEQVDSGWSVAKPTIDAAPQNAAQMRILLDHVLRKTEGGLQLDPVPAPQAEAAIRVAQRADSSSTWRAIGSAPIAPGSKSQEAWSPTYSTARRGGDASRQPTTSMMDRGGLEFRSPISARNETDVPIDSATAAANLRRPNPLPTDVLAPEFLPSAVSESRNRPVEVVPPAPADTPSDEHDAHDVNEPIVAPDADLPKESTRQTDDRPLPREVTRPAQLQPLTPQLTSLRTRLRSVLRGYYQKSLNSQDHDPWEVMHGMLAYGIHSRIRQGGPRGDHITTVGWLCYNRPCKGKSLLYVTPEGELRAKQGVGLQGHMGQLLAMLAQCHVSPDYPIRVGSQEFTVRDLIEAEKKTCYEKSELTFKLIAMSHYLDLDATWVNDQGLDWNFPKLISEELAQPIRGAACGGTHRLSGLSLAVKARAKSGQPIDGEYAQAAEFVKNYQNYAFRMQNRDGSLSTKWFQGPGDENDTDRRVKTTGHILEWLVYSLSDEELRDQRTIRAVTYLTNLMYSNYDHEWEVGPISHATHALLLYDERVFQPFDGDAQGPIKSERGSRGSASRGNGRR
jgi:hypothetical protein